MQSPIYYFKNPDKLAFSILRYLTWLPDKPYLKLRYKLTFGTSLNLKDPKTFNEKIQWLKLHDRNPLHTTMVDKYAVKEYVAQKIDSKYIIPTLGVWNKFDEINFTSLPNQFVLKTTHGGGSGGVVVCKNKVNFDYSKAKYKLENSLHSDIYTHLREWPYKNVPRKIIAEQYLEDEYGELRDYKFFCMNGEPKFLFVATGRMSSGETTFDFLDLNYKRIPALNGHPNMEGIPVAPENFNEMIEIARKLSQGETFVRVDLYNIRGKIYFGEYTFFHNSGLVPFEPAEWDRKFGDLIQLPN